MAMPNMFAEILPSDTEVQLAEIPIAAPNTDGSGHSRENSLVDRMDMSLFGTPTRTVGPSLGFSARLPGTLSEREAAELVAEAFDYMAVASGYLDPSVAITALRYELALPAAD
jgi:hypothetical protein